MFTIILVLFSKYGQQHVRLAPNIPKSVLYSDEVKVENQLEKFDSLVPTAPDVLLAIFFSSELRYFNP
jgi:hypothetical protein